MTTGDDVDTTRGDYEQGVNLDSPALQGATLDSAHLDHIFLDPSKRPNGEFRAFERTADGGRIVGYRTRKAWHIDRYQDGRYYSADWFSTADRACHPGLYLWPTLREAKNFSGENCELIKVETVASAVHHVGNKWRCQWFYVVGKAE